MADQITVGQSSGPQTVSISTEWNRRYRSATLDTSTPDSINGQAVAPPLMIALIGRISMSWIPVKAGAVHAKQSYTFHQPIPVDTDLTIESSIQDIFTKRGKDYVVIAVTVTDATGSLVAEGATTRVTSFAGKDSQ